MDKTHTSVLDVNVAPVLYPRDHCLTEMNRSTGNNSEFDKFARNYEAQFKPWLRIAGAPREFFARERLHWLSAVLNDTKIVPRRVMDFGCGTGMSLRLLIEILGAEQVIGLDTSEKSLAVASETAGCQAVQLASPGEYVPQGDVDLVFCNGVFHHIPLAERPQVVDYIYRCLRPGGIFAMWENNPWNLMQLLAMKLAELDRNAIPLSPPQARRLVSSQSFDIIRTDYLFFFPGWLRWAQSLEKPLRKVPLGAQYQVLARKD